MIKNIKNEFSGSVNFLFSLFTILPQFTRAIRKIKKDKAQLRLYLDIFLLSITCTTSVYITVIYRSYNRHYMTKIEYTTIKQILKYIVQM